MNIISLIMLVFSLLGALDRICGNRLGLGKEFEKGFILLGNICLSMIGMIVISPVIANLLSPAFDMVYNALHIDPSIIPASLFANDMGGASLSTEIAKDVDIGMFNALVVSAMMGCTVSYTSPYSLGVVKQDKIRELFLGFLCGFITIPVGCFVVGIFMGIGILPLLINLLPLIIFAAIIVCGLLFFPDVTVKVFSVFGVFMKILITIGLALGILESLAGIEIIEGLADIKEGADICFNAAVVLSGAFPFMFVVSKILAKPIKKFGGAFGINETAALGFVSSLVTNATSLEMINRMDKKGAVLNAAFAVSASFVFGGHLAFTMAFDSAYIFPMIGAKLISGVSAFVVGLIVYKRIYGKAGAQDNGEETLVA